MDKSTIETEIHNGRARVMRALQNQIFGLLHRIYRIEAKRAHELSGLILEYLMQSDIADGEYKKQYFGDSNTE